MAKQRRRREGETLAEDLSRESSVAADDQDMEPPTSPTATNKGFTEWAAECQEWASLSAEAAARRAMTRRGGGKQGGSVCPPRGRGRAHLRVREVLPGAGCRRGYAQGGVEE